MAVSCGAAVRGLSIDFLISVAGWTKTTSFVKHYLKPIRLRENPVNTGENNKGEQNDKSQRENAQQATYLEKKKTLGQKDKFPHFRVHSRILIASWKRLA